MVRMLTFIRSRGVRHPTLWLAWVTAILSLQTVGPTHAAIYVRIADIPGDVTTPGYDDGKWFEARSGSYGAHRDLAVEASAILGGTIGIGDLLPIGLACDVNRAAAPLLQAAFDGNPVGDVEIHLVDLDPGPVTFGIIKLRRAFVRDFTTHSPPAGRPWFQAFLIYSAIEVTNRFTGAGGTLSQTTTWDFVKGTGSFRDDRVANQPPTLSPMPALSLAEDTATTVTFTISDPDGPAANLSASATSSNHTLLPNPIASGDGASRSISLSPAPDQNGQAIVTVIVSDQNDSVSRSFELIVTPVPDAPAIDEIVPQVTETNTPITVTISPHDPDQGTETLKLTATAADPNLVQDSNITFVEEEGRWLMRIAPQADRSGSTEIRVTVTDDTDRSDSTVFLFTVNSDTNSAPTDILLEPDTIPENSPAGTRIGTLRAVDPDDDASVDFELVDDAQGRFALIDGRTIVSTPTSQFNHEDKPSHSIFLRATDPDGAVFGSGITIDVVNVNEPPTVTIDLPPNLPASPTGTSTPIPIPYPDILLSDPDAGAGDVTVSFTAIHGTLRLDDTATLFSKVSGNGTRNLAVRAALGDILLVLRQAGFSYSPDPGYVGADSLSVTLDDNGHSGLGDPLSASATEPFFLQAAALSTWLDEVFSAEELADPLVSGLIADFDRDLLATVLEFKLASNPRDSTDAAKIVDFSEITVDGQPFFQISFVQRTDESTPGIRLHVEVADKISGWRVGPDVISLVSRTPAGEDLERLVYRLVRSQSQQPNQFLRLSAAYGSEVP